MQTLTAEDLKGTGYVAATPRAAPQGFPPPAGAVRTSGWRVGTTLGVPLLAIGVAGLLLTAVPAGAVLIGAGVVVVVLRVVLRSVTTYSQDWVSVTRPLWGNRTQWVDLNDLQRVAVVQARGSVVTLFDGSRRRAVVGGSPLLRVAPLRSLLNTKSTQAGIHWT